MPDISSPYSEVVSINKRGVVVKNKDSQAKIDFEECSKNYANENSLEVSKCVATRDITTLTFTFYSNPKVVLMFQKRRSLLNIFTEKSAIKQFLELQNLINRYGYSTYDLS